MEFLNWHWIFYAMIPFLVISFVLGAATVPDIRHGENQIALADSKARVFAGTNPEMDVQDLEPRFIFVKEEIVERAGQYREKPAGRCPDPLR